MPRKILATILIIVLAISLAACRTTDKVSTETPKKENSDSAVHGEQGEEKISVDSSSSKLSLTPSDVNSSGFSTISCSSDTVMVVDTNGTLWGWGNNSNKQIVQDASVERVEYPTRILDNIVSVCAENKYTLAIDRDGYLWGWGNVDIGMSEPHIMFDVPVVAASAFVRNLAILLVDGTVVTGELGEFQFQKVLNDAICISAGADHTLAIKKDGSLWGWGNNRFWQLGNNTRPYSDNSSFVDPFKIMSDVVNVYAGNGCSYAIKADGSVWVWGNVAFDRMCDSSEVVWKEPTKIFEDAVCLAGTDSNAFVIKKDGTLWGWGFCRLGQLGNGTTSGDSIADNSFQTRPVKIDDNVLAVTCSAFTTYWIKSNRCLYGCGLSWGSRLGSPNVGNDMSQFFLKDVEIPIQTVPVKIMDGVMIPEDTKDWHPQGNQSSENFDGEQSAYDKETVDNTASVDANTSVYPGIEGDWQDSWSERCSMSINKESDGYYSVDVFWSSGASSYDEWKFSGAYDFSTGVLTYEDGIWLTCAEDESGYPQEGFVLDNMNGTLRFDKDSGYLFWTDNTSIECGYDFGSSNMKFERLN